MKETRLLAAHVLVADRAVVAKLALQQDGGCAATDDGALSSRARTAASMMRSVKWIREP